MTAGRISPIAAPGSLLKGAPKARRPRASLRRNPTAPERPPFNPPPPDKSAGARAQHQPALAGHKSPPQRLRDPALAACDPDGLVLHRLRGTACVRLRQAGTSESQIAAMVGMSVDMVQRYCRFAAQRDSAVAAVHHLEKTFAERLRDKSSKNRR